MGEAIGDLGNIIDSLEFDADRGTYPSMAHVAGDLYAIAYRGKPGDAGYIKTVSIDPDGNTLLTGGSLEFDAPGDQPKMIRVAGNVYAVVYKGPGACGWIRTVTISVTGVITLTGHSLEFDADHCELPDIIHVAEDVYAVVYRGWDGWLKTVTISTSGALALTGHSQQFDTGIYRPRILHIGSDVYAIFYDKSDAGYIKTYTIGADGAIGAAAIATLQFEASCSTPHPIHVAGDVYAIVYLGPDSHGWVRTVAIGVDGGLALTGHSLEFETGAFGFSPYIFHVSSGIYGVSYSGAGDSGWLKTLSIAADGSIGAVIDSLEFDAVYGYYPVVIGIARNIFAVAYMGPDADGWLCTVDITAALTGDIRGIIDELELAGSSSCRIIHVTGDVYAIAYRDSGEGWIRTVMIDVDGNIVSTGYSLQFDAVDVYGPDIIRVAGDVYAIAYRGISIGKIKTVTIGVDGSLAFTGFSLEFDTNAASGPKIIHVAGDVYAIAYAGPGVGFQDDGWMKTLTIDVEGNMALTGHSLEFDPDRGVSPCITHVAEDIYAIAYSGPDYDGWVRTVVIGVDGSLALTGESLEFDTAYAKAPVILRLGGNQYAIAYSSGGNSDIVSLSIDTSGAMAAVDSAEFPSSITSPDWLHAGGGIYPVAYAYREEMEWTGQLAAVALDAHGNITGEILSSLEFQPVIATPLAPDIIHIAGDVYALAYDGWIKTVRIALEKKAMPVGGLPVVAVADLLLN